MIATKKSLRNMTEIKDEKPSREKIFKHYARTGEVTKYLYDAIASLVGYVINRYFNDAVFDRDDFESMGMEASLQMLKAPHLDIDKNVQTVVFTKIRNTIRNHIIKRRVIAMELKVNAEKEAEDKSSYIKSVDDKMLDRFVFIGSELCRRDVVESVGFDELVKEHGLFFNMMVLKRLNDKVNFKKLEIVDSFR